MEIPVLNRICELGGCLSSLPNANFVSQIFASFSGFENFSPSPHFWKWSAVIIALIATFSGIIDRIKILVIAFRRKTSPISEPFCQHLVGRENGASISDNLRSSRFSCSELVDEDEPPSTSGNFRPADESDFRVKGSGEYSDNQIHRCYSTLRRRHCVGEIDRDPFSWSYLSLDRSIVKQWDNVRLGCDLDKFTGSVISLYEANKEQICSIFSSETQVQAASVSPPMMVLSAGKGASGNVSLQLWDTRVGSRTPVVTTEWDSPLGKIVDVYSDDVKKVYHRDITTARIAVGDVRNASSVLENSTEGGVNSWWDADADAVMVL